MEALTECIATGPLRHVFDGFAATDGEVVAFHFRRKDIASRDERKRLRQEQRNNPVLYVTLAVLFMWFFVI